MNNKVAVGLIMGALFAVAVGLLTVEEKYYHVSYKKKQEMTKEQYVKTAYPQNTKKEKTYSSMFMALGFLGGMGIGYIIGPSANNRKQGSPVNN